MMLKSLICMIIIDTKRKILHPKSKNQTIKSLSLKTARRKDKIQTPSFLFMINWMSNQRRLNK